MNSKFKKVVGVSRTQDKKAEATATALQKAVRARVQYFKQYGSDIDEATDSIVTQISDDISTAWSAQAR
jgi:hypothetical protein